jgi:CheY-like chemotaxis protein
MIEQILVVEPDKAFSDKLTDALKKAGPYHVVSATNLVEASLLLSRQSRDLAFIPLSENDNIVEALRGIQPDLRLVLTTPSAEIAVPDAYLGKVQAVLLKSHLESDLYIVLKSAVTNPIVIEEDGKPKTGELPPLETAVIIAALQRAELGNLVQTAVFAYKTDLLAHWGELNITQSATIALVVGDRWNVEGKGTLVQFIHLAARAGDLLLYTREVEENYLLTLVAQPGTPMRELRHKSNELVASLSKVLKGQSLNEAGAEAAAAAPINGNQKTYAIVWRPIRPIPKSLHIPLRRAIERLATANACSLSHISVHEKLIHLVVSCPPGRDSSWAVYLFKNGSEDTIQREYGVAASLWDTGHYAIESTEPLSEAELNLFLEKGNDS